MRKHQCFIEGQLYSEERYEIYFNVILKKIKKSEKQTSS